MSRQWGTILEVSTVNVGDFLAADASAGATSLVVTDARPFNELGGTLTLNAEQYAYTAVNPDTGTITLATGLGGAALADDRVELHPPKPVKTALVDMLVEGGEAVRATVPYTLAAVLADGLRDVGAGESVLLEERGAGELYIADITARADSPVQRMQSSTYAAGSSGFLIDENAAQLQNLAVVEEFGADTVTARSLTVNGINVEEQIFNRSVTLLAHDVSDSGINTGNIGSTETVLFEFAAGPTLLGHIYRFRLSSSIVGTTNDDKFDIKLRYTSNGTAPTTSSTLLRGFRIGIVSAGTLQSFEMERTIVPVTSDNFRIAVCLVRSGGTGTAYLYNLNPEWRFECYFDDLGIYDTNIIETGSLVQKSVASGSPGGTPIQTYTKTYWADWAASYMSSTQATPYAEFDPPTTRLHQGVGPTRKFGNQRSLFGLPYATMQSDLSGATIKKVELIFRVAVANAGGATLFLSSHNHTSKPSTFNPANVDNDIASWSGMKEGSTYTKVLANSVGDQFKAGTKRGLGFGPASGSPTDSPVYYGQVYGSGDNRPRLKITFTK